MENQDLLSDFLGDLADKIKIAKEHKNIMNAVYASASGVKMVKEQEDPFASFLQKIGNTIAGKLPSKITPIPESTEETKAAVVLGEKIKQALVLAQEKKQLSSIQELPQYVSQTPDPQPQPQPETDLPSAHTLAQKIRNAIEQAKNRALEQPSPETSTPAPEESEDHKIASYIEELEKIKDTGTEVEKEEAITSLQELKKYVDKTVQDYARRILDLGGGGGSVAKQFANGGIMDGTLNVTGHILSGGKNIADYFGTGGAVNLGDIPTLSGNWNSNYTTTNNNSAGWSSVYTSFNTNSGKYDSTYTTVNTYSGSWSTGLQNLSFDNSNYDLSISNGNTVSLAPLKENLSEIISTSASWNSNYTTTKNNSGSWSSVYTSFNTNSGKYDSIYTNVNSNSGSWSSVYTNVNSNSANYILDGGNTKGASLVIGTNDAFNLNLETAGTNRLSILSGGQVNIAGDLMVVGSLTALGDTTFIDTRITVASAMHIINTGTGPALVVNQTGAQPIANFQDDGSSVLYLADGGNIGIGNTAPASKLHVDGVITATGGNSNQWNSNYTTTNNNSGSWSSVYTSFNTNSGKYDSTYTNVNSNSAGWDSVYTNVKSNSANYILDGGNTKGAELLIGTNDAFDVSLETNGTRKLTITSTGAISGNNPTTSFNSGYATGDRSFAVGSGKAFGQFSHAEGQDTTASGYSSHAEGFNTTASGDYSHAEGLGNTASGYSSHAEGELTRARGDYSHAEGSSTTASGEYSHAEGINTTASVYSSHAEGAGTTASGEYSHAEGNSTTASGFTSHAEGLNTTASGFTSHAEGLGNTASGYSSHAEGQITTASGDYSHAEGFNTTASGFTSHAEGNSTTASGTNSHAEGNYTTASGFTSHAEGYDTTASGDYSHAEGQDTTASGSISHAEGESTTASGDYSHAEGISTTASGTTSHAEGASTTASGNYSHAEGELTWARGDYSHAAGQYSEAAHNKTWVWHGSTATNYVSSTRTNQFVVSAAGGVYFPGNVGIGTDNNTNALTVNGLVSTVGGNSNQWNSNYTTTTNNSGSWSSVYTSFNTNSGKYNSTYTNVNSNSAGWSSVYTSFNTNSGKYNSTYTNVNSNSGGWDSVYTSFNTNSGFYDAAVNELFTYMITETGDEFITEDNLLVANSNIEGYPVWNSATETVASLSANWGRSTAIVSLSFGSVSARGYTDQYVFLNGASIGDAVFVTCTSINRTANSFDVNLFFDCLVSAENTITIRAHNPTDSLINNIVAYNYTIVLFKI